jgi:hypothetical protein
MKTTEPDVIDEVAVKRLDGWHAESKKFPRLEGDERAALKTSLKRTKGNAEEPILYRMVNGKSQGLDGLNREELCQELGITPTFKRVDVSDDEVRDFIWRRNLYRRHLTAEQRRPFVEEMRAEGASIRTIAETLGVGRTTVSRDLSGVPNGTPDLQNTGNIDKIEGKDGKIYPSKSKLVTELQGVTFSPKILPQIEALLPGKQKDLARLISQHGVSKAYQMVCGEREPGEEPEPDDRLVDGLGHPVPDDLIGVFSRATEFRIALHKISSVQQWLSKVKDTPAGEGFRTNPVIVDLQNARGAIKFYAPFAVCPSRPSGGPCRPSGCLDERLRWAGNFPQAGLADVLAM